MMINRRIWDDKVQKLEKENLMEEGLNIIQTTKPSWAIEADAILVDLKDRSR